MTDATVVALAAVVVVGIIVVSFLQMLRSERRQSARERDLLVNQLLHAAGRAWQPPPANNVTHLPPPDPELVLVNPSAWPS